MPSKKFWCSVFIAHAHASSPVACNVQMLPTGCVHVIDQCKFVNGVEMKFCVTFVRTSFIPKVGFLKIKQCCIIS